MSNWQPSGVITITTDFGHKGPFAAVMTGVIVSRYPAARVIDLAHDIPAHWPPEAGFWLSRSYSYFPSGTVHVAIVDPGVGTEREILLVEKDGHIFMAPDNGLLAPTIDDVGSDTADWTPGWLDDPKIQAGRVSGIVVTIDAFGNLISNIDGSLIEGFESPVIEIAGNRIEMKPTYGRASPGDYLGLVNSFNVIEIARAEDSAAKGLGCERGAPVIVVDAAD